jgi:hypothetical protein
MRALVQTFPKQEATTMREAEPTPNRAFYDVFISYRHSDEARIDQLESKIREAGFEPFRDLNFSTLQDPADVTREKIGLIRDQLSRSTCLIFAYSRASLRSKSRSATAIGTWMPWELGFFDGAISSRIAVYLLDGPRGDVAPADYFKGAEYLQLYDEITETDLVAYLTRNAVRERRIDNVASAFAWLGNLQRESIANPANVHLGVAEWFSDHAARYWEARGNQQLADALMRWKTVLDDLRVEVAPLLRLPMLDELRGGAGRSLPTEATPSIETQRLPASYQDLLSGAQKAFGALLDPSAAMTHTKLPSTGAAEFNRAGFQGVQRAVQQALEALQPKITTSAVPARKVASRPASRRKKVP